MRAMTTMTGKIADEPRDVLVLGFHRVDRHAGAGRRRRPAAPVPRGRAGGRRSGRRAAGAAGPSARGAARRRRGPGRGLALRRELPRADVLAGPDAGRRAHRDDAADTVLNGITGSRGLGPTLAALATGATLALANKESLVAGGRW
jgi:hypothetical protein